MPMTLQQKLFGLGSECRFLATVQHIVDLVQPRYVEGAARPG